ncbi:MAG: M16 family metallopeptidase [Cyclobacteriaceae bacterium]
MADYELFTLSNGIRVVYQPVTHTKIVHCGFILDIGSRDENPDQQGLTHFWEHMAFKGTKKRRAFHIINRLESVGGELNAYTTKEKICFYASVLDKYFESAIELLTDITFRSVFPGRQIDNERKVILEEMAMYYDSPDDAIQDDFDELIFGQHQLGKNILGNPQSVKSFKQADFRSFLDQHLNTDRIIFSCVGNLPIQKIRRLAEKYLGELPRFTGLSSRLPFDQYDPVMKSKDRAVTQAHCAIGRNAFSISDESRIPFFILTNLLGGPAMNSRLNLNLREKHGLVYAIEASYTPYIDTGLFGIFFGTDPNQVDRSIAKVLGELKVLREKSLGTLQLHRAKEQLIGQLAMAEENNMQLMLMMGKSLLDLGAIMSFDTLTTKIKSTSATQLQDLAKEMFSENDLSILTFLPK